jgi:hypothetical protein
MLHKEIERVLEVLCHLIRDDAQFVAKRLPGSGGPKEQA